MKLDTPELLWLRPVLAALVAPLLICVIASPDVTAATLPYFLQAYQLGGTTEDYCSDCAEDAAGNTYLFGSFSGTNEIGDRKIVSRGSFDIYLAKFSPQRRLLWVRTAGGSVADYATAMAIDQAGNSIIAGVFWDAAEFGPTNVLQGVGMRDGFLSKYDPDGNLLWARVVGFAGFDLVSAIAVSSSGEIVLTGQVQFTPDHMEQRWIAKYSSAEGGFVWGTSGPGVATSVITDSQENVIVGGYVPPSGLVTKYSAAGALLWHRELRRPQAAEGGSAYVTGVAVGTSDQIYLSAHFRDQVSLVTTTMVSTGSADSLLAKYDSHGTLEWALRTAEGPDDAFAERVAVAADGTVVLAGSFRATVALGTNDLASFGKYDVFVAGYSQSGEVGWVRHIGGPADEYANSLSWTSSGDLLVAGSFAGVASFGGEPMTSRGGTDGYAASLAWRLPDLSVSRNRSDVIVSWSAWSVGFNLEVGAHEEWRRVSEAPILEAGKYILRQPAVEALQLYRLKK